MYFPIVCVDNFFDNPQEIRNLALSLEYNQSDKGYPGKRTEDLHKICPEYFNYFSKKLISLFYDFTKTEVLWSIRTCFQKIEPFEGSIDVNKGWVHIDNGGVFAGVVYLNEDANLESGTSIFKPKTIGTQIINAEQKYKLFENNIATSEIQAALEQNNNQFVETISFKNVYNRMVCYGSEQFHAVKSYETKGEPRLTQVFFVEKLVADWYPIPSSKLIK